MIDLSHKNEWQYLDESTGLIFPWYTKSCLDEIVTWDLKDKKVFEFGIGASTLYYVEMGCRIEGVDSNSEYINAVHKEVNKSVWKYLFYYINQKELFATSIKDRGKLYDIVIIDCDPVEWRDDCVKPAIECMKHGGKLIIDNWEQPSVWMPSEETKTLLKNYPCKIYKQPNHPDWQTLVATIQ